jgi:D-inositol-3-phosphate glycosyltransferase
MARHVALISEHASPLAPPGGIDSGGQNVYVAHLARCLVARGYDVDVFTRRDAPDLPEVLEWAPGVRIVHVPAGPPASIPKEHLLPYMGAFTAFILRFIAERGAAYEIIHANFWMSGLVAADLKRTTGTPFLITFHALGRVRARFYGEADGFPLERLAIEDRIVSEADWIIAECPRDRDDLIRLYNADPEKIAIVPCGFDPAELAPIDKPVARRALGLAAHDPIILQLGRMVPRKGVDNVIRGVASLIKTHGVPAHLIVAGGETPEPDPAQSPELARLMDIAAQEAIADRVTFVGRRERAALATYYSAADIFAVTPWYEPFGITPVEAMACGTPVVGAAVGGIASTVVDGETGYLVPPNDPEALAERLAFLCGHPALLPAMGRQAIKRANDLYTWQRIAGEVGALYERVLTAGPDRSVVEGYAAMEGGFAGAQEALQKARRRLQPRILEAATVLGRCFARGGMLLICGNGGSAADAQHLAAELVGRFKAHNRAALPAMALTADSATLTAWANDVGYDEVFARQVEAFGRSGDVLLGISTSGSSQNLVRAFEVARRRGLHCVALLGRDGGRVRALADISIIVPSDDTQHIQAVQLVVSHLLCELVEQRLLTGWPEQWGDAAALAAAQPVRRRRVAPAAHRSLIDTDPGNGVTREHAY